MAGHLLSFPLLRPGYYNNGNYRITGTVSELGVVGQYKVQLYERKIVRLIKETWSNPNTGVYELNYVKYLVNGYFVIAFDVGENPLNAAIADLVTPEPMP